MELKKKYAQDESFALWKESALEDVFRALISVAPDRMNGRKKRQAKGRHTDVSQALGASRTQPWEILAQQSVSQRSKLRLWKARATKAACDGAWVCRA